MSSKNSMSSVATTTATEEQNNEDVSLATLSENVVIAMNALNNITDFDEEDTFILFTEISRIFFVLNEGRQDDLEKICHLLISNGLLEVFIRLWDACHENTEEFYRQMDSVKFSNLRGIKNIVWNYSDNCVELAKICYRNGDVIERLMREFTFPQLDVSSLEQRPLRYMMTANLGILHNLVRKDRRNRKHIQKDSGIEKILVYEKSTEPLIKAKMFIVLAYCINEEENEKIMAGRDVIEFIIQELLSSAVKSPDHNSHISNNSFSAEETVMALNMLALNDANKKTMVKAGVLPLLTKLLDQETSSHSEHLEAVNCIWSLAFHPENKEKIVDVRNFLKNNGYRTWMDEYDMHGSILSAMADAVQNAALIIVAMTESYKNSKSCRQEAVYADSREVPILPLLMQHNYKADGWLGLLMGKKLYVDLSTGDVGDKLEKVMQEVAHLIDFTTGYVPDASPGNHDVVPRNRKTSVDGRESTVAEERAANEHRVKMEVYDLKKKLLPVAEQRAANEHRVKMEVYDLKKKLLGRKLELVEAEIAEKKN